MSVAPVTPARLLASAMASAEPGDSSTPTMILLMTAPSLVVDAADATAADPSGHPHEPARRCGELLTAGAEPRVEQRREILEPGLRRPVGAEHDVPVRGHVLGEPAIVGLPAHHAGVGVGHGGRVERAPARALQADGERRAALDDDGGVRQAAELVEERRAIGVVAERRVDDDAVVALELRAREAAQLRIRAAG